MVTSSRPFPPMNNVCFYPSLNRYYDVFSISEQFTSIERFLKSNPWVSVRLNFFLGGGETGSRCGDIFKTFSSQEQCLPLSTPYFKMFLERFLNDPPNPTIPLQASVTATPSLSTTSAPPPHKNFDRTLIELY